MGRGRGGRGFGCGFGYGRGRRVNYATDYDSQPNQAVSAQSPGNVSARNQDLAELNNQIKRMADMVGNLQKKIEELENSTKNN